MSETLRLSWSAMMLLRSPAISNMLTPAITSSVDERVRSDGMERIENRTFDEIHLGDSASLVRTLTHKDIELFAIISGDINPTHLDDAFAKSDAFHKVVAHGMWSGALISTVLGTQLPGPGTAYVDQSLHFQGAIGLGDTITVTVKVRDKIEQAHRVIFDCRAVNQKGEEVVTGSSDVIAPTEKISRPRVALPEVELRQKGQRYELLIRMTHGLEPIRTAVVHPVDAPSLLGAVEAARINLITPVLVGPESRIRAAAELAQLDLTPYEIVSTDDSEAAASQAVAMARAGKVEALMKGDLHTDKLMHAVVDRECGLRTDRRLSHVFAIDAPDYPRALFITDAAINIYPTLADKRDIIQNAIDLAHALGIPVPRVAILSAIEVVTEKIKSTLDAAALCKMADRGQITGGILDGPLAFDNAVSVESAKTKGIVSPVAGRADIFVVPDLEAGNMLAKQLEYLAEAQMAGIVLGARVPIILTSRADGTLARLGSCAIALLLARHKGAKT
jgi:phosphotransacetylase/acyl dehydratase